MKKSVVFCLAMLLILLAGCRAATGVVGEETYTKPAAKIDKSLPLMILDEKRMAANEERITNAANP